MERYLGRGPRILRGPQCERLVDSCRLNAIGEGESGLTIALSTKFGYPAGFGTHFGALDNAENKFVRTYHNLGTSIPHSPPSFATVSSHSTFQ